MTVTSIWSNNLTIGVDKIDEQHKELVLSVEQFRDACKSGKGKNEIIKIVKFLSSYTVYHFKTEEEIQKKYSFPESYQHKIIHHNLLNYVDSVNHKLETSGYNITVLMDLNKQLTSWLIDHISKEDKKIGDYIKSLG